MTAARLEISPHERVLLPLAPGAERRRRVGRLELLVVLALAGVYLLWFAWPLFWSASQNVRLVGAFNPDEETHVRLLSGAIASRTLRLEYIQ